MPARHPEPLPATVTGSGPRLVLVHGFTQTRGAWGTFAAELGRDHELVLVDAPGHGASHDVHADLVEGAARLGAGGGRAAYLGYSMGGRLALRLAVDRPELVRALVLIGASPGIEGAEARAARRHLDDALAARLEAVGVEAFVDEWLRGPLFATLPAARAQRAERVTNTVAGLASSLRLAGTGTQESLWSRLDGLTMPVLLLAGERDEKFSATAREMAARIGAHAQVELVPEAGHSAHLEQPEATAVIVRSWLRSAPS